MSGSAHYDDGVLLTLVDPALEPPAVEVLGHVTSCDACTAEVDAIRRFTDTLKDPEVWTRDALDAPPPQRRLQEFLDLAGRLDDEDLQAAERLPLLLDGPRDLWQARLGQQPRWWTAGMVRTLFTAIDRVIDTVPADAAKIASLAADIADGLDPDDYPGDTVLGLRGAAWREKAFALYFVGQLNPSLVAIERAEAITRAIPFADFELARVWLVRALILRSFERSHESILLARKSAVVFAEYGDARRVADAQSIEAIALYRLRRFPEALAIWTRMLEAPELAAEGPQRVASLLINVAGCHAELQQFDAAAEAMQRGLRAIEGIDVPVMRVRARWSLSRTLAAKGDFEAARRMFSEVHDEFRRLRMEAEANEVALENAEVLLILGRPAEVEAICRALLVHYQDAGLAHTYRAVNALNSLREAAALGKLTPQVVRHVKQYIARLPAQPNLLFAPLPLSGPPDGKKIF